MANLYKANKKGGVTPTGTKQITTNGTHDVTAYASAEVNVPSESPNLQTKTITAGTSAKTVQPDSGYDGFSEVTVNPTPSNYKTVTATTTTQIVSPDSGTLLNQVTVNPQSHTQSINYSSNGAKDLGANHNVRYVNINVPSGSLSETTLWTNSSPSSSFAAQAVSEIGVDNYTYIKITFRFSASNSDENSYIVKVSEFKNVTSGDQYAYGVGTFVSGEGARSRRFYYVSGGVGFTAGTSISSQNNNVFIPIKITGLR